MATRQVRGAVAVLFLAAAAFAGGCGGDGNGPSPVLLAGDWSGSLSISYTGGASNGGAMSMTLGQEESFVSGVATWAPATGTLSVAGPVEGSALTLFLHFRCDGQPQETALTGAFDGTTLVFSGGSGFACPRGGVAETVAGASGSFVRSSDAAPL